MVVTVSPNTPDQFTRQTQFADVVPYISASPDGKTLALTVGGQVILNNLTDGLTNTSLVTIYPPAFSSNGQILYARMLNPNTGTPGTTGVDLTGNQVIRIEHLDSNVSFSAGETFAYAEDGDGTSLWDMTNPYPFNIIFPPDNSVNGVRLDVIRKQFADTLVETETDHVLIWDVKRPAPHIADNGIVNGATYEPGKISPGNWATAFGRSLSFQPTEASPIGGIYPSQLDTARVQLQYGGETLFAPLHYVSPSQINFLVPADVPTGTGTLKATPQTVNADGSWTSGNTVTVDIAGFSPGIYAITDQSYRRINDATGTAPGSVITLWANGLGTVQLGQYGLMWTTTNPFVTIAGVSAQVLFSGLAPGYIGLYQVNVVVPQGIANGVVDLQVAAGGMQSPTTKILISSSQR